jgi:hypothetical protein
MDQNKEWTAAERLRWQPGRHVCRKDSDEPGAIVEADGSIKVKGDGGSTSYFRHLPANVRLKEPTE